MINRRRHPITILNRRKLPITDSQKKLFILEFTKEMIRNSGEYIYILDNILKDETKKDKRKILLRKRQINKLVRNKLISPFPRQVSEIKTEEIPHKIPKISSESQKSLKEIISKINLEQFKPSLKPIKEIEKPRPVLRTTRLRIPEPKLPSRFEYLKPTPGVKEISLGRLDPLLKDPMVKIIDCKGPSQNIIVTGNMGTKKTGITLSSEEIEEVIDRFSKASKIPVFEGVYKVVVGRFIFLAVISEVIGSKFSIRKMIAPIPSQRRQGTPIRRF